jgi:hypothetical protein
LLSGNEHESADGIFPYDAQERPMKLSVRSIDGQSLPAGKREAIYFDGDVPGFGLRIREGGSRTFVFQYKLGSKQRRMVLGKATRATFDGARKSAQKLYARVQLGQDPAGEKIDAKAKAAETFEAAAAVFLQWQRTRPRKDGSTGLRPRSLIELERYVLIYASPLHRLQLSKIHRAEIATCIAAVTKSRGVIAANRTRTSLSAFFSWAITEGLIEANPVIGTRRHEESERERVLEDHELRQIWNALADDNYGAIVKLLMLTAQRKGEIAGLQWPEIKGGTINLPPDRTKTTGHTQSRCPNRPASSLRLNRVGPDLMAGCANSCSGLATGHTQAGAAVRKDWTSGSARRLASH